ncbi:MAG: PAS domain-containing protein [Lentisphaerae bacterium]|nr:PAS domain-containing protein [Lentisphaerota bacterium]
MVQRGGAAVLLVDILADEARDRVADVLSRGGEMGVVVFGATDSEPVREAEAGGAYAVLAPDAPRREIQAVVDRALERVRLMAEVRDLRAGVGAPPASPESSRDAAPRFRHFFTPLRHCADVGAMTEGIIDGVVNAGVVMRAGLFVRTRDRRAYRFRAGVGCPEDIRRLTFAQDDPLVDWLDANPRIVSPAVARGAAAPGDRTLLQHALDMLGAELIVPLQGREGVMGWLLLGPRAAGGPYDAADLRDIMLFAEHISTALENALLSEDAGLQRVFAETLLHTIPTGIVAVDPDATVQWFNESAAAILGTDPGAVLQKPVETVGSRMADRLRRTLEGRGARGMEQWADPATGRSLAVRTTRLASASGCLGAVAFVQDMTRERALDRRQRELERAAFWTELAASMSHEVRNPLVAIKTFAQLLPERYNDEEFRTEFSALMSQEVDRLNGVIEQINQFANLPKPEFREVDLGRAVEAAIRLARERTEIRDIRIESRVEDDVREIRADKRALTEGMAHLLANALEAVQGKAEGRVEITAHMIDQNGWGRHVEVAVSDNGSGMPAQIRANVFSPFCTTKTGGMGLGLPIVQRTMSDHNGRVEIDTSRRGTRVSMVIPLPVEADMSPAEATPVLSGQGA